MNRKRVGLPLADRLTAFKEPVRFANVDDFKAVVYESCKHGASDIYIQPYYPIVALISNEMYAITQRNIDAQEVNNLVEWASGRATAQADLLGGTAVDGRFEIFDQEGAKDSRGAQVRYAYRVNISAINAQGKSSAQIVMRLIPNEPPTIEQVGLDPEFIEWATPKNGMVLVCGETGSGKSTTFASIIRFILENETRIKGNIITHEQPIEFTYSTIASKHSIVVQSQIPNHFKTFALANESAMRRHPFLAMIGEIRDDETVRAAVELSLTGHPVFGTVHASEVATVVRRLISRFPAEERATAICDIVEVMRFIIAQRLVRKKGGGLVAAREYLLFTPKLRQELYELTDMSAVTNRVKEMVTTDGHSFSAEAERLLKADLITRETADLLISQAS